MSSRVSSAKKKLRKPFILYSHKKLCRTPQLEQPILKEAIASHGVACFERQLSEVLCKPKILPIKSMALEKVEKIERDAQLMAKKARAATARG